MPIQAPGKRAKAGDKITMHCKEAHAPACLVSPKPNSAHVDKFDDATKNYTQTVLINGAQVSTLSTEDGHAQGWGSAVECAENNCGTVPAHSKSILLALINVLGTYIFSFSMDRHQDHLGHTGSELQEYQL